MTHKSLTTQSTNIILVILHITNIILAIYQSNTVCLAYQLWLSIHFNRKSDYEQFIWIMEFDWFRTARIISQVFKLILALALEFIESLNIIWTPLRKTCSIQWTISHSNCSEGFSNHSHTAIHGDFKHLLGAVL